MTFDSWFRRHLADEDPTPAPASPPPFTPGARVIVSVGVINAPLARRRGQVLSVEFTTDPDNPYGPWVVTVLLDVDRLRMILHAAELTREPTPPSVRSLPMARFRSVRNVPVTPIYDQVREEALAVDGFANQVEADLKTLTEGSQKVWDILRKQWREGGAR